MANLNDLIRVYENSLETDICDFLISVFEENFEAHNIFDQNIYQFNLSKNRELSEDTLLVHNHIIKKIFEYRDEYYEFVDKRVFPQDHAFEEFHIRKYSSTEDNQFFTHVDVTNYFYAKRFLGFTWYLNDTKDDGITTFKDLLIYPTKGKLVMYPPYWMYPHKENIPTIEPKYTLTAFLHYK